LPQLGERKLITEGPEVEIVTELFDNQNPSNATEVRGFDRLVKIFKETDLYIDRMKVNPRLN